MVYPRINPLDTEQGKAYLTLNANSVINETEQFYRIDVPMETKSYEIENFQGVSAGTPTNLKQDISYTYDPVGNITSISDSSHDTVFHDNQQVDVAQSFTYDSLYRLTSASGREKIGLNEIKNSPYSEAYFQAVSANAGIGDGQQVQNYTREYQYDKNNNLKQIKQTAGNTFTRDITISDTSNRGVISTLTTDSSLVDSYFDANGNLTELEHLQEIGWNYRDNISKAVKGSDTEYYIYDASGNRVRKISILSNGEERETIYLGGVEVKRIHQGPNKILERYDNHVMDDTSRIAIVNRWRIDTLQRENNSVINDGDPEVFKTRYQYGNHLGSASLELDGSGVFVSYQEYFLYGGTSYTVGEVSTEYRFTGKEMDDFTGLYYFGARYYISWIGRWMSADPKRENEDGWTNNDFIFFHTQKYAYKYP